jgi:hypothetical protein
MQTSLLGLNGDEDVATPALGLERGGDVFIAVGEVLWERATGTSPPRPCIWNREVVSSSPWRGALGEGDGDVATPALGLERGGGVFIAVGEVLWERATRTSPPRSCIWNGEVVSSSPWRGALGEGDEDVATPALGLERGGGVFIAVGEVLWERATGTSPPRARRRIGQGRSRRGQTQSPVP